jgi:tricorn protease
MTYRAPTLLALLLPAMLAAALPARRMALAAAPSPTSGDTRLMRFPDLSRDRVVFTYAGDLWTIPREGGEARRLTAHPGDELFPKFSPDGRWIAFSGEYDGNVDVYVIPAEGGEPRRLTWHPAADLVLDWKPDGKQILFRSTRISFTERVQRLFEVGIDGGLERPLPLPSGGLASYSPDGGKLAYNPSSAEFRTWKRYRGGFTTAIGIYDLRQNSYEEIPRDNSNDMFPMWSGNAIYFDSDRDGIMNLYRYDLGDRSIRQLTHAREYDVKWPSLGDGAIVYEEGGWLNLLDLASEQSKRLPVHVDSDKVMARPELRSVSSFITAASLSPGGKRVLIGARGDVFTVPVEHGSVRNLTQSPGVHELNPTWSPDGEQIAYLSDRSGEYELYVRPQKGGDETRITLDGGVYRYGPLWSPDSKKLLFWDKTLRLWYVDLDRRTPIEIDREDYQDFDGGAWSPDSRWIAYTKTTAGQTHALYLYSLEKREVTQVSSGFYDDRAPAFAPDGKVLYFISSRYFHPAGDRFDWHFGYFDTDGIFAITLLKDGPSPFGPRSDEEGQKDDEDGGKDGKGGKDTKDAKQDATKDTKIKDAKGGGSDDDQGGKKEAVEPVKVDLAGLGERIVPVPVPPGNYSLLGPCKGKLFYRSTPVQAQQLGLDEPDDSPSTLHVFDLKKREDKVVLASITRYALDKEGSKVLYVAGQKYGVVDAADGQSVGKGAVDVSGLQTWVDPQQEWKQLFHEALRIERDFYWDPAMKGLDWKKIGDRYEQLLPYVAHRGDLNYLIGELIGELSTSHTYVSGGDLPKPKRVNVGLLGVDFEESAGYYRFAKIYSGQSWSPRARAPLGEPGLKVAAGNYLIAVNGQSVRAPANPYSFFQGLADQVVTLKLNDKPSTDGAWEIVVQTLGSETRMRYLDWVEANRRKVAQATGGRAGYMHVPNTFTEGLIMFDQYLSAQFDKDGLVIDERYNSGGAIPDFYTEKLGRRLLALLAPREGKDQPWPPTAVFGPKVMLANEYAGSGGDCFPWFFQKQKIGPVVGARTWGGLVGISRNIPMMDGGVVTAPETAFWTPDGGGQWIVENKGVDPDYPVPQRPDLVVSGHDPQLEKAIELVNQGLAQTPKRPQRPAYPKQR